MAQVIVEFAKAGEYRGQAAMPVMVAAVESEEVTTSGTSAATTLASAEGDFVSIYNADVTQLVWARIAATPTAAVAQDFAVGPGERREFGPLPAGMKVAVINDS